MTLKQATFLFEEAIWEMELNTPKASIEGAPKQQNNREEEFLFKDPKEYENLTPEEKKAKTEAMLKHWKVQTLPGGALG